MTSRSFTESVLKDAALAWLASLGYTIDDGTFHENARAQLRVLVKRILRKYGYPPDKQEKATQTVLEQAEVLSGMWASAH